MLLCLTVKDRQMPSHKINNSCVLSGGAVAQIMVRASQVAPSAASQIHIRERRASVVGDTTHVGIVVPAETAKMVRSWRSRVIVLCVLALYPACALGKHVLLDKVREERGCLLAK